jgi:hypothetical protein
MVTYLTLSQCAANYWTRDLNTPTVANRQDLNWMRLFLHADSKVGINNEDLKQSGLLIPTNPEAFQNVTQSQFGFSFANYTALPVSLQQSSLEERVIVNNLRAESDPKSRTSVTEIGTNNGFGVYMIEVNRENYDTKALTLDLKVKMTFAPDKIILDVINDSTYSLAASKQRGVASVYLTTRVQDGYFTREFKVDNQENPGYSFHSEAPLSRFGMLNFITVPATPSAPTTPSGESLKNLKVNAWEMIVDGENYGSPAELIKVETDGGCTTWIFKAGDKSMQTKVCEKEGNKFEGYLQSPSDQNGKMLFCVFPQGAIPTTPSGLDAKNCLGTHSGYFSIDRNAATVANAAALIPAAVTPTQPTTPVVSPINNTTFRGWDSIASASTYGPQAVIVGEPTLEGDCKTFAYANGTTAKACAKQLPEGPGTELYLLSTPKDSKAVFCAFPQGVQVPVTPAGLSNSHCVGPHSGFASFANGSTYTASPGNMIPAPAPTQPTTPPPKPYLQTLDLRCTSETTGLACTPGSDFGEGDLGRKVKYASPAVELSLFDKGSNVEMFYTGNAAQAGQVARVCAYLGNVLKGCIGKETNFTVFSK